MNLRYAAAAALAAVLAVGSSTAGARTSAQTDKTLVVWLQVDAQQAWPDVVSAATKAFEKAHPGVNVKVEYQRWGDHLTKLDASFAGNNAPDVVELGNTETTKYMAAGAFANISSSRSKFSNSKTWLRALTDSCTFNGKLFCVPYYAGARGVIYRKDFYRQAGVTRTPTSLAEFVAAGKKLMKDHRGDPNFSAFYFPGKYWYAGMSYVYDYGGSIAVRSGGKWHGALSSKQSIAGLTKLKSVALALSRADKTGDEAKQDAAFAAGHIASIVGNGWEWGVIVDPKAGDPRLSSTLGAYPMPSHVKGKVMPTFLGGSDLAVTAPSKNRSLAVDWIKAFTSTGSMRQLATTGGVIPNTTALVSINKANPQLAPFARAANASWFVPTAPNWVNVENAQVLPNMLVSILTGRQSVKAAAAKASSQITKILNASQ